MNRREIVEMEIENFILYFTSDDKERADMMEVLKVFMDEVYNI